MPTRGRLGALESRPLVVAQQAADAPGAYFDVAAARRAIEAIESFKHTKGRWGSTRLKLSPWQTVWVIAPIFGWLAYDPELGRADAVNELHRLAVEIVQAGIAERYGVCLHPLPWNLGSMGWGVYLDDRTPGQAPPHGLTLRTLARRLGLAA